MNKFESTKFHLHVQINRTNLETELATNPAALAYYIEQAALWSGEADRLKILRDNRGAEIYVDLKSTGKATDGFIDATKKLDGQFSSYEELLRLAREQLALYEGAVTALDKKQFSLGSLNRRNELEENATTSTLPTRSTPEERADRRARFTSV